MNTSLQQLLQHPAIWQASRGRRPVSVIPTGHRQLDNQLHDGGWPRGATTELLGRQSGAGELRLLLPALRQQQLRPWLALLAPPFLPYAPALAAAGINSGQLLVITPRDHGELLWCADQALRSGSCGAVITWSRQQTLGDGDLRKLQQAAHQGNCWHVLFRPQASARQASPSALRIHYNNTANGDLQLQVLKQRGGWGGQRLTLSLLPELQQRQLLSPQELPVHLGELPSLGHARHRITAIAGQ